MSDRAGTAAAAAAVAERVAPKLRATLGVGQPAPAVGQRGGHAERGRGRGRGQRCGGVASVPTKRLVACCTAAAFVWVKDQTRPWGFCGCASVWQRVSAFTYGYVRHHAWV
eukprot:scaffold171984_cov19-Tisochrysis_lutea.AAC.1